MPEAQLLHTTPSTPTDPFSTLNLLSGTTQILFPPIAGRVATFETTDFFHTETYQSVIESQTPIASTSYKPLKQPFTPKFSSPGPGRGPLSETPPGSLAQTTTMATNPPTKERVKVPESFTKREGWPLFYQQLALYMQLNIRVYLNNND
jgi:hypothetical protein